MFKKPNLAFAFSLVLFAAPRVYPQNFGFGPDIDHVLLISIDGMHAVDYENCVNSGHCPNLAALGKHGVNYTRTSTSRPSDSFPGLMALVTGGTPKSVGAFYDVAYDRVLAPPATTTGNGLAAGTCNPGKNNGTQTEYEEGDEINQLLLNGGGPYKSVIDGGVLSIDPTKLVRDPFSRPSTCAPVYPWNFIRTNTIFGVIHKAGGYTAWSDKHAVYAAVSGPTGTATPSNVDDYYSPEVNSNQIPLPGVKTAGTNFDCSTIQPSGSATVAGNDWTTDFQAIQCYDQLKVNAVLNWIDGKTHLGASKAPVPVIFGMNFQAVSVGEKLIENGTFGGYTDAAGNPTPKHAERNHVRRRGHRPDGGGAQGPEPAGLDHHYHHRQARAVPDRPQPLLPDSRPLGNERHAAGQFLGDLCLPAVRNVAGPGPTEDDISQLWLSPGTPFERHRGGGQRPGDARNAKAAGIGADLSTAPRSRRCLTHPACPPLTVRAAVCCPEATRARPISSWRRTSA